MNKLISLIIMVVGSNVFAQETPPFANISSIEYRGTGCDAESARASITPDLSYISILYDRFSAEIGQGTANPLAPQAVKNCAVIIKLDIPAGWSFQFDSVEYNGFVSLPNENTVAMQMISAFSSDGRRGRNFQQNVLRGPKTDNFVTVYRNPVVQSTKTEGGLLAQGLGGLFRGGRMPMPPPQPPPPDFPIAPIPMPGAPGHPMPGMPGRGGPAIMPGFPGGPGGIGGGMRRWIKRIRNGDMFDCSEAPQQAVLRIASNIVVRNLGDRSNPTVKIAVDSTDSSVQKLKINWNKCLVEQ